MITIALLSLLSIGPSKGLECPSTKIVNKSNEPWTELDQTNLNTYIKGNNCSKHTKGRLPCLVKIIKKSYNNYHLICGEKR